MSSRALAIVSVSLLGLLAAATAAAGTTLNQSIPFTSVAYNSCTEEFVAVEGNLHTTSRVTLSGDRVHIGVTSHFTGVKGTTTSGARYTMMDVENQQTNFSTNFAPSEFTAERTMNLTRLGEDGTFVDGDDLRVHVIAHMTVNANGFVTADKLDARSDCR
ncbi:MAG: hypothetical protein M3546_06545 [Actinomycetota bacterium]|nr:hypothetical protein [Actinomycetota bacterium]